MKALRAAPFLPVACLAHSAQSKLQRGLQGTSYTYSYTRAAATVPPYWTAGGRAAPRAGPFKGLQDAVFQHAVVVQNLL